MKREDIEFLKELQNELKTQPNDGQAEPKFWMVIDEKEEPCAEGFAEGEKIYDSNECEHYDVEDFVKHVEECYIDKESQDEWENLDKGDTYDLCEFCVEKLNMDVEAVPYRTVYEISDDTGAFLTKRACQKFIDKNYYHYNKPRTYAMTAWRNPEFERVLNILTNMNLDDIKVD